MSTKNTKQEALDLLNGMGIAPTIENLVYYAQEGRLTEVKNLVWAGADLNSVSNEGFYAINQSAQYGRKEVVAYLLSEGAKPSQVDKSKYDALCKAAYYGHNEIVQLLIQHGAELDGASGTEYCPLSQAIQGDHIQNMELLMKAGANPNKKDIDGKTPVERAFLSKNKAIYGKMVEFGVTDLSKDQKKALRADNGFMGILKQVYAKDAYVFLGLNLFAFIIIFFVLDEKTGGGIGMRIFSFLFCTVVGGLLGMWWSRKREGNVVSWFRYGAGTLLLFATLIMWANNGYVPSSNNYNSGGSSSSGDCTTCSWCGGRGVVGYAGESEEQVRRTGNGLGNPCITCGGDGCE